jgi:hypothetical protein
MASNWFLPWDEVQSYDGVSLEKQPLGQYRVRVYSDLIGHRTYYFFNNQEALDCFGNTRDAIRFEKSFLNSDL